MKTATDIPAILTIYQTGPGQYLLRTTDIKWKQLLLGTAKLLDDARTLTVVTPADTKFFMVGASTPVNGKAEPEPPAPDAHEPIPESDIDLDPETLAAIQAQEDHAVPGQTAPGEEIPGVGEVVGETAQGTKVIRRKPRTVSTAGHPETCSRCRGAGKTRIILEGGQADEAPCPICHGVGSITRYGTRR